MKLFAIPLILTLVSLFSVSSLIPKKEIPFTSENYHHFTYFFESKKEMMNFFDLRAGDVIADIGAAECVYEGVLSLDHDSLTFYAEDIDSATLNKKNLDKMIKQFTKIKGAPLGNTFHLCIGSVKETRLPDNTFDKIILMQTIHEFTYLAEMLKDIKKKLKPSGKLYVIDAKCLDKGHVNYKPEVMVSRIERNGFKLLKKYDIDSKNGGEDMYTAVFEIGH
jgi:SAM-dependent methyltransferase